MAAVTIVIAHSLDDSSNTRDALEATRQFSWLTSVVNDHLPSDCNRIVIKYTSQDLVQGQQSTECLGNLTLGLLQQIQGSRSNSPQGDSCGPIIFVGHGLGGTIIKNAIIHAARYRKTYGNICLYSRLFLFMNCLHRADTQWEYINTVAGWLTPAVDLGSPFLLDSIKTLANAISEINDLFLETGILQIAKVISILPSTHNRNDSVASEVSHSLGISHETIVSLEGEDDEQAAKNIISDIVRSHVIYHGTPEQIEWLQHTLKLASPIQMTFPLSQTNSEMKNRLLSSKFYLAFNTTLEPFALSIYGRNAPATISLLKQLVTESTRKSAISKLLVFQFTFDRYDHRRNSALSMVTYFIIYLLTSSITPIIDKENSKEWKQQLRFRTLHDALSTLDLLLPRSMEVVCALINVDHCESSSFVNFLEWFKRNILQTERHFKLVLTSDSEFRDLGFECFGLDSEESLMSDSINRSLKHYHDKSRNKDILDAINGISDAAYSHTLSTLIMRCDDLQPLQYIQSFEQPITPQSFFQQTMERIGLPDRDLVRMVMIWVLYSFRPLSIQELTTIVLLVQAKRLPSDHLSDRSLYQRVLSLVMGQLWGVIVIEKNEVSFSHPDIRHLLSAQAGEWFNVDPTCHSDIVLFCLKALQNEGFLKWNDAYTVFEDTSRNDPAVLPQSIFEDRTSLHWYVITNWPEHYKRIPESHRPRDEVQRFFSQTNQRYWAYWADARWMLSNPYSRGDRPSQAYSTALPLLPEVGDVKLFQEWIKINTSFGNKYIINDMGEAIIKAALVNCVDIVEHILLTGDSSANELLGGPMLEAAAFADSEVLLCLIQNAPDSYTWPESLLERVAGLGLEEVVIALIERGCLPNAASLHRAASNGHAVICDLLLSAYIETTLSHEESNALFTSAASSPSGGEVFEALMKHEKKIMAVDNHMSLALYRASTLGHFKAVEALVTLSLRQSTEASSQVKRCLDEEFDLRRCRTVSAFLNIIQLDENEKSALLIRAIKANSDGLVCTLLDRGANVDANILHVALGCEEINLAIVKSLVEKGVDLNTLIDGTTPLILVASRGNSDCMQYLIEHGARVNDTDDALLSPLMMAARHGQLECITCLVNNGADIEWRDDGDESVLFKAAGYRQYDIVNYLLNQGAKVGGSGWGGRTVLHLCLDSPPTMRRVLELRTETVTANPGGSTPMHYAAYLGKTDALRVLLDFNVDVEGVNGNGYSPLMIAIDKDQIGATEILLEAGADARFRNQLGGWSALHFAKTAEATGILLQYGADVNVATDDGHTALHRRFNTAHPDLNIIKRLLGARADINRTDRFGCTPLNIAIQTCEDMFIFDYLLSKGADPNIATNHGFSPLYNACREGNLELVKRLHAAGAHPRPIPNSLTGGPLEAACITWNADERTLELIQYLVEEIKADVNHISGLCFGTALNAACARETSDAMRVLIDKYSANLNTCDYAGRLPIHLAAATQPDGFRYLVTLACDPRSADKMNRTALHWAAQGNNVQVLELLLQQADIDVNAAGKDGWTALCWAARGGNVDIIECLLKHGADKSVTVQGYEEDETWTLAQIAFFSGHKPAAELLGASAIMAGSDPSTQRRPPYKARSSWKQGAPSSSFCNYCQLIIAGSKYECKVCYNFDYCFRCFRHRSETHDPKHEFEVVGPAFKEANDMGAEPAESAT